MVAEWPPSNGGRDATLSRFFQSDTASAASMPGQAQPGAARADQPQRAAI
jgi:hypothetical protein